jgi:hypothetical protein
VKSPGQWKHPSAFRIIGKTTGSASLLGEEGAIALTTNLGENGGRGMCRVGNEVEPLLFCRPANRRRILDVVTNKVVRFITRVHSLYHAAPTKLEGDACRYWWLRAKQGIGNVEVVLDIRVTNDHRGCGFVQVDMHHPIGDAYRPEQAARSDTRIEVMDLIVKIIRDNLPLVEIQSDEAERIGVLLPIHPNVDTLHEAHIRIEVEGLMLPRASVDSCSSTLDFCNTNRAFEVGDR